MTEYFYKRADHWSFGLRNGDIVQLRGHVPWTVATVLVNGAGSYEVLFQNYERYPLPLPDRFTLVSKAAAHVPLPRLPDGVDKVVVQYRGHTFEFATTSMHWESNGPHGDPVMTIQGTAPGLLKVQVSLPSEVFTP